MTKVKNKTEVIAEAKKGGKTAHFASLMDLCHLKNSELEPKFQKFKGRVVFRGDIVKNDSGSCAVCTEQGSSASQMTAAKIMDITSRLPGCARQAADAVSAYTHLHSSQNGRSTDVAKNSQIGMYHDTNGLNRGPVWKSQLFFLSEICTVIFWQDCYGKGQLEKVLLENGWKKVSNWECLLVHREKRFMLICVCG